MDIDEEVKLIYSLMREINVERRELTKQYYDLKYRLDKLKMGTETGIESDRRPIQENISENTSTTQVTSNSIKKRHIFQRKTKKVPFERIATYITEILKSSEVPLANKEIYERLTNKYEVQIQYSNLTSNILPRIHQSNSFHIERAYRGFWQYRNRKEVYYDQR
ncbi:MULTISPECIES: hypothetical protein [Enterococcus]|uniref:hypothetical protein n=1 Tax=Enterococcus TaxID=1350 RepID=UPI00287F3FA6|nr:hypothetical protein [Enterococcus faecium]